MKPKIFVTRLLPKESIDKLKQHFEVSVNLEDRVLEKQEMIEGVKNQDALLCLLTDNIDKQVIAAGNKLKVISNYAVGSNNIDIEAANSRKIPVCITPGVLTNATADLTFGLILGITRRIVEADKFTREGSFKGWGPQLFLGAELAGKTLGIIGMGRIGEAVAKRAMGFDMQVFYYSRTKKNIKNMTFMPLNELLKNADIISLHTPLTPETHHLIGKTELQNMKKTAYLINTTRGAVINEMDLLDALKTKTIAGAGLDVYEQEPLLTPGLTSLDNVILLPHIGSATTETRSKMAIMAVENAIAIMEGTPPHALANPSIIA